MEGADVADRKADGVDDFRLDGPECSVELGFRDFQATPDLAAVELPREAPQRLVPLLPNRRDDRADLASASRKASS
jgi:hypothetical protein